MYVCISCKTKNKTLALSSSRLLLYIYIKVKSFKVIFALVLLAISTFAL